MLILTRLCNEEIVQFVVALSKEALSHANTCILGPCRDSCRNRGRHKRDTMFMLCFYAVIYWVYEVAKYSSCDCMPTFRHFLNSWAYCSECLFEITLDKCKVNFFPAQGMKTWSGAGWRRRNVIVLILKLDTKQDSRYMYIVTWRCVRSTFVAADKQGVLHNLKVCICIFSYPACNAHVPYCLLWPARFTSFSRLSYKRLHIRKKVLEQKMCVLIFSTILFETFLILGGNQRDMIKNVYRRSCKVPVILVRF